MSLMNEAAASYSAPAPRSGWELGASCAQVAPGDIEECFYPSDGRPIPQQTQEMCAACPVREECLATALQARYQEGIWGGVDMRNVYGRLARARRSRAARST